MCRRSGAVFATVMGKIDTNQRLGDRAATIVDEYLAAIERHGPQDATKWLDQNGDCKSQLEPFLSECRRVAEQLDSTDSYHPGKHDATKSYSPDVMQAGAQIHRPDFTRGDLIEGKFRVLDVKQGGMGRVFFITGVHDKSETPQAVMKTVAPFREWRVDHADASGPLLAARYAALLYRFRRESINWVRLEAHPNIVFAQTVHEVAGRPFLFLEYADSGDLAEWIKCGRVTVPIAVDFALQFCAGMAHAGKSAGLVHRDIKPANVLIHDERQLKITDLGLARAFAEDDSDANRQGSAPSRNDMSYFGGGTRPYMPPEQFISLRDADTRSDVFSFGVMLFEMLTGQKMFGDVDAYRSAAQSRPVPQSHEMNAAVPEDLSAVVSRCVAYDRNDRHRSFNAVAQAILKTGLSKRWKMKRRQTGTPAQPVKERRDWGREIFSLLSLGQYAEAEQRATKAIQAEPTFHGHWLNRGKALAEMKQYEEAHRCYAEAARLNPDDVQCWFNVALALACLGRFTQGIPVAETAIAVDSQSSDAWAALGNCQLGLGRFDDAHESFCNAVGIDEHNWRAVINLGVCLNRLDRTDEALEWLRRGLRTNPDSVEAWYEIAAVHATRKEFTEAHAAIQNSLKLRSDQPDAHILALKATTLWQLPGGSKIENLREAIRCLKEIFEIGQATQFHSNLLHTIELDLTEVSRSIK